MSGIKRPLRLAFIGGSIYSAVGYTHFVASALDNKWELVAGCFSRNRNHNLETGHTYGVEPEHIYNTWLELIEKARKLFDAVVILLPTPQHFEVAMKCMEMGIPVICEKALATSATEGRQLLKAKKTYSAFLAVTYNYSGYPMLRELREMVSSGKLGHIVHYSIEMPQEGFIRLDENNNKPVPQKWRLQDGIIPTIYLDLAVHIHELIHYLLNKKPLEVVSSQATKGWFEDIADNVYAICRHEEGIEGQWWFSKSALGHRNGLRIRIYGTSASAEWIQAFPEELVVSYVDGNRQIIDRGSSNISVASNKHYTRFKAGHPAGFIEAFANLYADIAEALAMYLDKGSWNSNEVFGVELALEGLSLLEAMVESSLSGKWEAIANSQEG